MFEATIENIEHIYLGPIIEEDSNELDNMVSRVLTIKTGYGVIILTLKGDSRTELTVTMATEELV